MLAERRKELVRDIYTSQASDFYRSRWGPSSDFMSLPYIDRSHLVQTPLSHRTYKDARMFVKIVSGQEKLFPAGFAFEDIIEERFGIPSQRPLVYLQDAHEAFEKGIWCYGNGMVPLVCENDAEIAAYVANKYRIDSLIIDPSVVERFIESYLHKYKPRLQSVTVIGDRFQNVEQLLPLHEYTDTVRLCLALPETGIIAEAPLETKSVFTTNEDCYVEHIDGGLVVTKVRKLITPIIKYRTYVHAEATQKPNSFIVCE